MEDRTVLSLLTVTNNFDSGTGWLRGSVAAAKNGDTINVSPDPELFARFGVIDLRRGQVVAFCGSRLPCKRSLPRWYWPGNDTRT
jgi:hypothetical protein